MRATGLWFIVTLPFGLIAGIVVLVATHDDVRRRPELTPELRCHDDCVLLHVYVSNQSFLVQEVDIIVSIDGEEVIADRFHVEDQHNWVLYEFQLEPGVHALTVRAPGYATLSESIDLPAERWAVLDFWSDGRNGTKLTLHQSDRPVGFD